MDATESWLALKSKSGEELLAENIEVDVRHLASLLGAEHGGVPFFKSLRGTLQHPLHVGSRDAGHVHEPNRLLTKTQI